MVHHHHVHGRQSRLFNLMLLDGDLLLAESLIPSCFQDETNSLVWRASGFVARQSQITADMLLPRASPYARHPARLSLILNAT